MHALSTNIADLLNQRLPAHILCLLRNMGTSAHAMGVRAYVVGGLVRDLFLYRNNLDVDVVIEGDGIAFASGFSDEHGARLLTYEKFGTANIILPDNFKIDVATARTETYQRPAALPTVTPGTIKEDMFRRDFSINTLVVSLDPERFGDLLDFYQGRDDIRRKLIRVLHNDSFIDDPTRIFRAVRFEKRFDFRIDDVTERLMRDAISAGCIERLSGFRIASELEIISREKAPVLPIRRLEELGVLPALIKRGENHKGLQEVLSRINEIKLMV